MKRGGEGSAAVSGDAVAAAILAAANAANSNTAQALVYVNHEYEATEESELSMAVGDVLEVLSEDTSGWWQGVNRRTGLEGWFPSTFVHWCDEDGNYLGETNPEEQGAGSVADDGSAVGNSFAASEVGADGVEYAYAVADFEATEENEMTLYVVAPAALVCIARLVAYSRPTPPLVVCTQVLRRVCRNPAEGRQRLVAGSSVRQRSRGLVPQVVRQR